MSRPKANCPITVGYFTCVDYKIMLLNSLDLGVAVIGLNLQLFCVVPLLTHRPTGPHNQFSNPLRNVASQNIKAVVIAETSNEYGDVQETSPPIRDIQSSPDEQIDELYFDENSNTPYYDSPEGLKNDLDELDKFAQNHIYGGTAASCRIADNGQEVEGVNIQSSDDAYGSCKCCVWKWQSQGTGEDILGSTDGGDIVHGGPRTTTRRKYSITHPRILKVPKLFLQWLSGREESGIHTTTTGINTTKIEKTLHTQMSLRRKLVSPRNCKIVHVGRPSNTRIEELSSTTGSEGRPAGCNQKSLKALTNDSISSSGKMTYERVSGDGEGQNVVANGSKKANRNIRLTCELAQKSVGLYDNRIDKNDWNEYREERSTVDTFPSPSVRKPSNFDDGN